MPKPHPQVRFVGPLIFRQRTGDELAGKALSIQVPAQGYF
jgi:hypothetical protein